MQGGLYLLSKFDIERQIGKGISIVPFCSANIKENSINFTLSNMAWRIMPGKRNDYNNAQSACKGDFIILEPKSTTIVYTEEVIALNHKFGGTFHSKVGIVSKGVVFCSTMIGPSYCGHLLIALQNPTDFKIKLKVGETFISLVLHKMDTPIKKIHKNTNAGGHTEKLEKFKIHLTNEQEKALDCDWKKNIDAIIQKLHEDDDYVKFKKARIKKESKYWFILMMIFFSVSIIAYIVIKLAIFKENIASLLCAIIIALIVEVVSIISGLVRKIFGLND